MNHTKPGPYLFNYNRQSRGKKTSIICIFLGVLTKKETQWGLRAMSICNFMVKIVMFEKQLQQFSI
jgi:hypothetical protein